MNANRIIVIAWVGLILTLAGPSVGGPDRIVYRTSDGLADDEVYALEVIGETVYAGTAYGLSWLEPGAKTWQSSQRADGDAGDLITCLESDGDTLWVGTDAGLARFDNRAYEWRSMNALSAVGHSTVSALLASNETLWVGCWLEGLHQLNKQNGAAQRIELPKVRAFGHGGPRPRSVHALAAIEHRLFVGTERGLLMLDRKKNSWSSIKDRNGFAAQMITALDASGDTVWIGTAAGPARYQVANKHMDVWTASWQRDKQYPDTPTANGCPFAIGFISSVRVHQDKVLFTNFRSGGSGYFDIASEQWHSLGIPGKAEIAYTLAVQGRLLWAATPKLGRGVGLVRQAVPW